MTLQTLLASQIFFKPDLDLAPKKQPLQEESISFRDQFPEEDGSFETESAPRNDKTKEKNDVERSDHRQSETVSKDDDGVNNDNIELLEFIKRQLPANTNISDVSVQNTESNQPLNISNLVLVNENNGQVIGSLESILSDAGFDLENIEAVNGLITAGLASERVPAGDQISISLAQLNEGQSQKALNILSALQIQKNGPNFENILKQIEQGQPILLNLTPDQITQLQNLNLGVDGKGLNVQAEALDPEAAALLNSLISLLPPQKQPDLVITPRGVIVTSKAVSNIAESLQTGANTQTQNVSSQLNALTSQSGAVGADGLEGTANPFSFDDPADNLQNFERVLRQYVSGTNAGETGLNHAQAAVQNNAGGQAATGYIQSANPTVTGDLSLLQNWGFPLDGSLLGSFTPEGSLLTNDLALNPSQFFQGGNLTNLVTNAQSAGQSHPATQLVSVTLQRAAGNGEPKNLTLRLDPPDLGRVEVKMSFDKKAMKAIITAEKPETYLMFQRDAGALEKSLQDAGIDIENGLEFKLAEEGFDFSHNGGHDGQGSQGGSGNGENAGAEDEGDLIETTLDWFVDPLTGHTHYSILA